jgi:hypothetical protein
MEKPRKVEDEDSAEVSSATQAVPSKETKLPHLSSIEELSGFSYHLCGVIDALEDVREVTDSFAVACGVDDEEAMSALARIQVELFFHLVYHVGKLKRFLIRLNRDVYKKLDEDLDFEES